MTKWLILVIQENLKLFNNLTQHNAIMTDDQNKVHLKVKEFKLLSKFSLNFEVRSMVDNKEIPSTESVQMNSDINSNETTQELFRQLLNKFDDLNTRLTYIETNIANIESNIMTDLNGVKQDLATLKSNTSRGMHEIKNVNRKVEESQDFLRKQYDAQQKKIHDLTENNKKMNREITQLHVELNDLVEKSKQNKTLINQLGQYHRSSCKVELTGIPSQNNKNVMDYVAHLNELANISNYLPSQVDIAHRTSTKPGSPIIILFVKKRDRLNFFSQKSKIKDITGSQFQNLGSENTNSANISINDNSDDNDYSHAQSYVYLNESLTAENRRLLKEARTEAKKKNFKIKGHTVNGQVRVRKSERSEPTVITCRGYLLKFQ